MGNSGQPVERWAVARIDGAYPRRERRGIAPVPRIIDATTATASVQRVKRGRHGIGGRPHVGEANILPLGVGDRPLVVG